MGKKLDRLLGRGLKTAKLKPTINVAIARLAILKSQRTSRCSQARNVVVQFLQQGHHERALLRVEQVIKEQNTLDAYAMMESYFNLLIERVYLIEHEKECPEELKEAVSTLIFASSRCGDFPELTEIRAVFQSHYGKEFVTRALELRNHCGVSTKMIQKLSTLQPSLEIRIKLLKEIAVNNNIDLHLDEAPVSSEGLAGPSDSSGSQKPGDDKAESSSKCVEKGELSDSFKARQNYKDVADAAQAAFMSAAHAAHAARAAVELSRSSGSYKPDGPSSPLGPKRPEERKPELEKRVSENKLDTAGYFSGSDSGSDSEELNVASSGAFASSSNSSSSSLKQIPSRFQAGLNVESDPEVDNVPRLNLDVGPISMRARRVRGY